MFSRLLYTEAAGETVFEDRFREVEMAVSFRKADCYRCGHNALYKYRVLQLRRRPEILAEPDQEVRPDHRRIWSSMPRFAEIPETVKCKRCGEVIGFYTSCIF